ncbi:MAG: glycosyl hydrolase 53 family protein [Eubacterium sp.]
MKTNKLVWKIVSVVIALAMVVTMMPTNFLGIGSTTVKAVSVGDEMFSSFSATAPSASAWYSYSSSTPGWGWGANQSADGYASGLAFEDWFMSSGTVTGYAYYTVSSMPAGTYTLTCTVDSINIGSTSSKTTIYPYVGDAQVTSYSIAPYVSTTWSTSAAVSNGDFSYTFSVAENQTNYNVGFYVEITAQQQVHLNDWSLTCDSLVNATTYSVTSTSAVNDVTITTESTAADLTSALPSSITVNSVNDNDATETHAETLALTWDTSGVTIGTEGTYTATYSYTSEYVGSGSGSINVKIVAVSSDRAYKDIVTGTETTTGAVELEWGDGNVPGTFESGTLSTSGPSTSGIYASSTNNVTIQSGSTYAHGGSQYGRMTGSNSYKNIYINGATSAASSSTSLSGDSYSWSSYSSSVSYSEVTYNFTPTASTYYLNIGIRRNSNSYVYTRVKLVGVDTSTEYTCTFYYAPVSSGSSYYVYIDDITVTYQGETTVDKVTRAYYDYAGTYAVDTASVALDATASEVSAALPTYITADLVLTGYEDDEDYSIVQALPVTWDTSSISTATVGSYTVSGTATYGTETINVETKLNVTEIMTYIEYAETGLGSFENDLVSETNGDGEWTFFVNDISWDDSVVSSWIYDYTDTTADNYDSWKTSSADGNIMYVYWMQDAGVHTGAYTNTLYDEIPEGTFDVSFSYASAIGAELGVCIKGYVDGVWTEDYYPCQSITNTSLSTWAWSTCTTTINVTSTYTMAYIGIYAYSTSAGAWGNIDAITITGPAPIPAEAVVINADNPIAVNDSDGEGWALTQLSTKTDSYMLGDSYNLIYNWYWDDTTDDDGNANYPNQYTYGAARYGTLYTLEAGTYTWEFDIAGKDVIIYPYVVYSDGTTTTFDDAYLFDTADYVCDTYETVTHAVISFDIEADIENCYVGLYADTSTSACWLSLNSISIYYGEPALKIYDDQIYNGEFTSSPYGWTLECDNDITDYAYGYKVDTAGENTTKSLNIWCNSEDGYSFVMYQYVRLNTAGDYKLFYDTMGWLNAAGEVLMELYQVDENGDPVGTGDAVITAEFTTEATEGTDEWYTWTTYETDTFTAEAGNIYQVIIYGDLLQYSYIDLDNIQFVDADAVIEEKTYLSIDDFTNGGWDLFGLGHYWTATGDIDESESGAYGYSVGADWSDDTNGLYLAWNNSTSTAYTYTLVQKIKMTQPAQYLVSVDSRGWIGDGTATITVTDDSDNTLATSSIAPSSESSWTSLKTDLFEITTADTVITVTVTINLAASSDGTSTNSISLDNFAIAGDYVAIDNFENGDFEDGNYSFGNYWTVEGAIDNTNYYYGYSICDDTWSENYDSTTSTSTNGKILNIYNNQGITGTYTYTMTQKIRVDNLLDTSWETYAVSVDAIGDISGTAVINVYNEAGTKLVGGSIVPTSTTAWETFSTGGFTPTIGDIYIVEIVVTYDEPTSYTGDDGNTYYSTSTLSLDNITFAQGPAAEVDANDQIGFQGIKLTTNSNGVATTTSGTNYFNGGNLVKGVDVSSVISLENAGVTFSNSSGIQQDLFQILADNGVNYIRIRVWNAPYTTAGVIYGGGNNDANVATAIAQRAADVGMSVYVDFMLSDWWADPTHQIAPKAWSSYSVSQKASAAYTYVYSTLVSIANTGADIGIVSIGNETNSTGIAGETTQANMTTIMVQGMAAIADFNSAYSQDALRALHVAPSGGGWLKWMIDNMYSANSDLINKYCDLFAFSCYPYYTSHSSSGSLSTWITQANLCSSSYSNKPILIAEYDWPYTWTDTDSYGTGQLSTSTSSTVWSSSISMWDVSETGQTNMIKDMLLMSAGTNASSSAVDTYWGDESSTFSSYMNANLTSCIGSFYWEAAWVAVGSSWSSNSTKWGTYGCGTGNTAGSDYASWGLSSNGGTVHDILSMFDSSGTELSSAAAYGISVDKAPLDVAKAQVQTTATNSKYSIRFVGGVDTDVLSGLLSSSSASVGFKVEYASSSSHTTIANKSSQYLYTSVKANGSTLAASSVYDEDTDYLYTYCINNIPTGTTYYWKVITYVESARSYQESIKYYKTSTSGTSVTLTAIDPWDYPGYNAELDGVYTTSSGGTTNSGSGTAPLVVDLYPSYMQ